MYLSLKWYPLAKSYDDYRFLLSNLSLYRVFTRVVGKRFYNDTFLFHYIASASNNQDIVHYMTNTELDEFFLVYNIYQALLFGYKRVVLDTYNLFYLNTPSKYEAKDLIKIDLIAQTSGVRKVKEFHIGKNFIGYFYSSFLSVLNHGVVYKSKNISELIENLNVIDSLNSFKSKNYAYLEYLGMKISDILKALKPYLYSFDFKYMLDIVKGEDPNSYAFDLYLNIYFFYNTSSIIIDIDFYLKYAEGKKNQNFKAFLTLDRSFYVYKDINNVIKTGVLESEELEKSKKDVFKSDYFLKRRYTKISLI